MKTSFLPRPHRDIRPAPEPMFQAQPAPVTRTRMPWDTEPDQNCFESDSPYTAFPQAPEATGMLTQDLEPFYRTK